MSAGHHSHHRPSDTLDAELKRLMGDSRVKKLLARPYKVDFSYEMPLTGGSSDTWGTFYLDPGLKGRFRVGKERNVEVWRAVLEHEVVEKALRMVFGMAYDRAHRLATTAEHHVVTDMGLDWEAYKALMERIVRRDERERPTVMPKGFDFGPLHASRGIKALKGLKARAA